LLRVKSAATKDMKCGERDKICMNQLISIQRQAQQGDPGPLELLQVMAEKREHDLKGANKRR
jgi:hypothetical protein